LPLYVPLDAVFEKDGRTVVYRADHGTFKETEVKLGKKNQDYVIIEEGLKPDDRVALRDPTLAGNDISGMTTAEKPGNSGPEVR